MEAVSAGIKVSVSGTLEFRDANGNVIETVEMAGSLPLANTDEVGENDGVDNGS